MLPIPPISRATCWGLFRFNYTEGNFGGNQLWDGSICLPSITSAWLTLRSPSFKSPTLCLTQTTVKITECTQTHIHTRTHVHTHTHAQIHTSKNPYIHIDIHLHVHIHLYIHVIMNHQGHNHSWSGSVMCLCCVCCLCVSVCCVSTPDQYVWKQATAHAHVQSHRMWLNPEHTKKSNWFFETISTTTKFEVEEAK